MTSNKIDLAKYFAQQLSLFIEDHQRKLPEDEYELEHLVEDATSYGYLRAKDLRVFGGGLISRVFERLSQLY